MFDFELDRIVAWIRDGGYASVALQLPEGLKIRAAEVSLYLTEKTGVHCVIVGYPCYGACDLFDHHGVTDALVHFGHSPIPAQGDDRTVLYVESRWKGELPDLGPILDSVSGKVGLLATIQYLDLLPIVKEFFSNHGREAVIGSGDRRICYPGQVLGCNCTAAESIDDEVDSYLFVGEGDFHPLAAALGTSKPVIVLDPITGDLRDMGPTRDRLLRKRFAAIQGASNAHDFLIIVSTKIGQKRMDSAKIAEEMLKRHGLNGYVALMEEINPMALMSYRVDAYVNTACPRIALDDSARYDHPMLTVPELEIALGERAWDDYLFDQIRNA